MGQLKKYRLLIPACFIVQISFIFILRFTVFQHMYSIFAANLFFIALLAVSVIPFLIYTSSCFSKNEGNETLVQNKPGDSFRQNSPVFSETVTPVKNLIQITESFLKINRVGPAFENLFSLLAKEFEIGQAVAFTRVHLSGRFETTASYAFFKDDLPDGFETGEGIPGQVAKTGVFVNISEIPDNYVKIVSGLGQATPRQILIFPVISGNETIAVIEMAFLKKLETNDIYMIKNVIDSVSDHILLLNDNNNMPETDA